MKKTWINPAIEIQQFEANEYVASCWGVSCNVDAANKYEEENHNTGGRNPGTGINNISHALEHCGNSNNQVIRDSADGKAYSMTEIGTDGLGNLNCVIYTDSSYNNQMSISSVTPGSLIYWTTSAGTRTWHHQGIVQQSDPNRPNHS